MASDIFAQLFDDPQSWGVFASGFAEAHLTCDTGPAKSAAVRLDYDFHEGKGFVGMRKEIQFALPTTFEFRFMVKGGGAVNRFEFKIVDPAGVDTWRYLDEAFVAGDDWREVKITERDLPFGWGPEGGGPPKVMGAIELVIAASEGGKGNVSFSDFAVEDQTLYAPKACKASSSQPNYPSKAVFLTGSPTGWRARKSDLSPQWRVDFGRMLRFGGLVLHWPEAMPPREFDIEISDDGEEWRRIFRATCAKGRLTHVAAPLAQSRHLRINFAKAEMAALCTLELKPDSFSHTTSDFIHAVAVDYPRGWFPRYWCHEQSYWTPVGTPEGGRRALLNEEGLLETDEAGFSLEPFLFHDGKLLTWADVTTSVSLTDGGAPMPVVTWELEGMKLLIMPWVEGTGKNAVLHVTYSVENPSGSALRLAVAARPFQVTPPWQSFREIGGCSPIRKVGCDAKGFHLQGRAVTTDSPADTWGAAEFEEQGIVDFLAKGTMPERTSIDDESALGSAALAWDMPTDVPCFEVTLSMPFFNEGANHTTGGRERCLERWHEILAPVVWNVPASASTAIRCFRTAAAHILINRDGPALHPGPRRYSRSWIRDCVIMGAAMAKAGHPAVLRDFILWYAAYQREDGYIPAVVDQTGVDPLVENDSHGQFLWAVCEVHRQAEDLSFLKTLWPSVRKGADYLICLRGECMTEEFSKPDLIHYEGLLPESASHEGYLAHPVHSYWDDFWGVRGLEAAAELADAMGMKDDARRWHAEAQKFLRAVMVSIQRVIKERNINYVPGSVEWADFDPTATANAIAQLDFADDLPADPVCKMFDLYFSDFRKKRSGEMSWLNYTAYEIRIIGAFVRIGRRDDAHELLEFFLSDRRPLAWNQWPEITWRDPRSPGHLGDVPHTWIAAEYMLALASMIASEREGTEAVVLASGLPWRWISEDNGFSVRGLRIRIGALDFKMFAPDDRTIHFEIGAGLTIASGGLFVSPPLPANTRIAAVTASNGETLDVDADASCITLTSVPVVATITLRTNPQSPA